MTARYRFHRPIPLGVYITPFWAVNLLQDRVTLPRGHYQERGAGTGAIITAVNDWRAEFGAAPVTWTAYEVREDCRPLLEATGAKVEIGDYLPATGPQGASLNKVVPSKCDVIIGNPDYKIAAQTIEQALGDAPIVAMLLPIGFVQSAKRGPLFKAHPCMFLPIPDRVVFVHRMTLHSDGHVSVSSTDSTGSCWLLWGMGAGSWERLPEVDEEIRAAAAREAPIVLSRKGAPGLIPESDWPLAAWECAAKIRGTSVEEMRDAA